MATTNSDKRVVNVTATEGEIGNLLGKRAFDLGVIDFIPDAVRLSDLGDGTFEVIFEVATNVRQKETES